MDGGLCGGWFFGVWLDRCEPERFGCSDVELSCAVAEGAEHVSAVILAEDDLFAEVVGELWVSLDEVPVDDPYLCLYPEDER